MATIDFEFPWICRITNEKTMKEMTFDTNRWSLQMAQNSPISKWCDTACRI